ncbi:MAG: SUF system NifU family Fe-S cluster assembly protein [Candidatus Wildermuthbacteria bacterium GWA2_46_15]|uniref:SUF system NifU family Fe-S cluster assembly protein n=1 Tax=Candidatus Wildermuthbacteria bacterium GWA2_46_15 TaxID=1802443 RepID=A0A1G2QMM8_9BACT|nr:MAG: SUF system NifU family Fe-S cluster assembly protein [Candidatus Wildermuthbacteria bacterium GWA2_46_15]
MSSIYQEIILEHWKRPHNYGRIKSPSKKTSVHNPSCGDRLKLEILFNRGKVKEAKFTGQGCAISQASASLLTDHVKGKKAADLEKINQKTIIKLLGVEIGPARQRCALLSLEALKKIIEK